MEVNNSTAYDIYNTTSVLSSVIKRKGDLLATGTWKHFKVDADRKPIEIENSPFVQLMENPNPFMSGNDFMRQWNENESVFGNNFMLMLKGLSIDQLPKVINNLPPAFMQIKTKGFIWRQTDINDVIDYYYNISNGSSDKYFPDEIIHTKIINGQNPLLGESPLIKLNRDISNIRLAMTYRNVAFGELGALGYISPKSSVAGSLPFTEDQRIAMSKEHTNAYGIHEGQARLKMSPIAIDFTSTSFALKEMMVFEEFEAGKRAILDYYGMNENVFTREKASTFNNVEKGYKMCYESTIIPDSEEKAMTISKRLGLVDRGEFLHMDYSKIPALKQDDKVVAETLAKRVEAMAKLRDTTLYNDNDIRAIGGLEL